MRKLGWVIIALIIVGLVWTILALQFPMIGQGSRYIFVELLGENIVNGITGLSTSIMLWGSTGFLPAFAIFLFNGVFFLVIGVAFNKFLWSHRPEWLGNKPKQTVVAPLQSQLGTPDLYVPKTQAAAPLVAPQVEKKVEEKTA